MAPLSASLSYSNRVLPRERGLRGWSMASAGARIVRGSRQCSASLSWLAEPILAYFSLRPAGKPHDKTLAVPNLDGEAVRLRERFFNSFLVVCTFGDFDAGKVAVTADSVDAIRHHDANSRPMVPAVTFQCRAEAKTRGTLIASLKRQSIITWKCRRIGTVAYKSKQPWRRPNDARTYPISRRYSFSGTP